MHDNHLYGRKIKKSKSLTKLLERCKVKKNIIGIFPGKLSQGSSRQFASGEGNRMAYPQQKTMLRLKPSQLLCEPQHCPQVSGAIHHCNEEEKAHEFGI